MGEENVREPGPETVVQRYDRELLVVEAVAWGVKAELRTWSSPASTVGKVQLVLLPELVELVWVMVEPVEASESWVST